jgi:hypothetical protein
LGRFGMCLFLRHHLRHLLRPPLTLGDVLLMDACMGRFPGMFSNVGVAASSGIAGGLMFVFSFLLVIPVRVSGGGSGGGSWGDGLF